jgi:hypothetical protein
MCGWTVALLHQPTDTNLGRLRSDVVLTVQRHSGLLHEKMRGLRFDVVLTVQRHSGLLHEKMRFSVRWIRYRGTACAVIFVLPGRRRWRSTGSVNKVDRRHGHIPSIWHNDVRRCGLTSRAPSAVRDNDQYSCDNENNCNDDPDCPPFFSTAAADPGGTECIRWCIRRLSGWSRNGR